MSKWSLIATLCVVPLTSGCLAVAGLTVGAAGAIGYVYYDKNEAPGLQLTILATGATGEEVCNLQTEISAPPGHLVVLGMTPTGTMTSVFVVQVLRQEARKPQK